MRNLTFLISVLFLGISTVFADNVLVSNLADLRGQTADGTTVYEITGEIILTHQHGQRNQKYFQDASAAILVDDNSGIITSSYNLYDGVTGLTGTLTTYRELLQFVPTADPGAATSTGNEFIPQLVTLADIAPVHQGMLVRINNVDFTGAETTFSSSTNYAINDGTSDAVIFRTPSSSAALDYFGTPVPTEATDMFALIGQFDNDMQIFSRSLADFYPDGLPSYTVTFNVIDEDDAPITDAVLTFDSDALAAGTYTIEEVNAGSYSYSVEKAGYFTRTGQVAVTDDITVTVVLVAEDANAISTFPWNEDFEGEAFPPSDWSHYALGQGTWATTATANTGDKAAWHNFTTGQANSWLVTPQIQIGEDDNILMKFFQRNGFMNDYGFSAVLISEGSGNPTHEEFEVVYEASTSIASYAERIVSLGDYAGKTIYIAFQYEGTGAHQWFIDDVVIEDAPEAIIINDLSEFHDATIGGDLIYLINGEVVITHMHGQRNQKYIQDATGALLIDDQPGVITTVYNQYDGITGLKGKLSSYNGLLQLNPTEDPGAATSTGNVIEPLLLTMDQVTPLHQSMLLAIKDVSFNTDLTTLEPSTNYDVTDGTATLIMRPPSQSAVLDYFGTPVPATPVNMIVLGAIFGESIQFFPRSLADIDVQLSTQNLVIENNAVVYPNPFSGHLTVQGLENCRSIEILNGLGQTIETIDNPSLNINLNTSEYQQGIYFIRFIQNNGNQFVNKLIKK